MEIKNIEVLQAKEYFFAQRKKFLTYRENKDQHNIELARKEYLEWKEAFCRDSSDETLLSFIELMKAETKGEIDSGSIEFDAIMPVQDELYNRAVSSMKKVDNLRVSLLVNEGMRLTKYYDKLDLGVWTMLEMPKDVRGTLDKYINKVLNTCTLEECVSLVSRMEKELSEYIKRTFGNPYHYTKGYNIKVALTDSVKERVIEETYSSETKKEEKSQKTKRFGNILSQRKW